MRLTEAERKSLTGNIQRTLRDGETGLDEGDCNRAGWHISENLMPAVERILTARSADMEAQRDAASMRSGEWARRNWNASADMKAQIRALLQHDVMFEAMYGSATDPTGVLGTSVTAACIALAAALDAPSEVPHD